MFDYDTDKTFFTITRLQVVLDVCVEVPTQAAGSAHKLGAEFDVNGAAASLPGQREAVLLRHQNILRDVLQLQVMDVMRQLQTKRQRQWTHHGKLKRIVSPEIKNSLNGESGKYIYSKYEDALLCVLLYRWPLAFESHVGGVQPNLALPREEEADGSLAGVGGGAAARVVVDLQAARCNVETQHVHFCSGSS